MPNYSGIWTEQGMMQAVAAGTWSRRPGAPTIGTATATGPLSATVAFTASSDLGFGTVTYTATSSPGGLTATGTSPITMTGLSPSTSYTFTVTATNSSGSSTSSASNSITTEALSYVEDVFSTYLYTGTNSTQSIVNGIDLSTKGGMCWFKIRDTGTYNHALVDTARVRAYTIGSDISSSQYTSDAGNDLASFNTNGFTVGPVQQFSAYNRSGNTIVNWTFRKQPKFFDVVTYTGTGSNRTIAHSLGSVPGWIMVKRTDASGDWQVYHRSLANTEYLVLNSTAAKATGATRWNSTTPTSTVFSLGTDATVNASGGTYVAYIFAHDAGGFGDSGSENIISCGSFTTDSSGNVSVNLGYEPQFVMWKKISTGGGAWNMQDNMRGMREAGDGQFIEANSNSAEYGASQPIRANAIGFYGALTSNASSTYIYIAIRKGPQKPPTVGTTVFNALTRTGTNTSTFTATPGFTADMAVTINRTGAVPGQIYDARRGGVYLRFWGGFADDTMNFSRNNTQVIAGKNNVYFNSSSHTYVDWYFREAPKFFNTVLYDGNGTAGRAINHGLTVVPELILLKMRNYPDSGYYPGWLVYHKDLGNTQYIALESSAVPSTTGPGSGGSIWNNQSPTSSVFYVGDDWYVNKYLTAWGYPANYVAYLFATCPGVSKVGSYTGTGTTKQIDCGFTTGARMVFIKRTNTTGNWLAWDTARGIVSGNDPYITWSAFDGSGNPPETTTTDYIDPYSAGFELSSTAPAAINASGGSYIFFAVA